MYVVYRRIAEFFFLAIEDNFLGLIKDTYGKPTDNIIFVMFSERLKIFPLRLGKGEGHSLSLPFIVY